MPARFQMPHHHTVAVMVSFVIGFLTIWVTSCTGLTIKFVNLWMSRCLGALMRLSGMASIPMENSVLLVCTSSSSEPALIQPHARCCS